MTILPANAQSSPLHRAAQASLLHCAAQFSTLLRSFEAGNLPLPLHFLLSNVSGLAHLAVLPANALTLRLQVDLACAESTSVQKPYWAQLQ